MFIKADFSLLRLRGPFVTLLREMFWLHDEGTLVSWWESLSLLHLPSPCSIHYVCSYATRNAVFTIMLFEYGMRNESYS